MSETAEAKTAIVILGAPNDDTGALSHIARERCDQGLREYRCQSAARILPTGGWGAHFNTTPHPHHHYTRAYLQSQGVPAAAFVEGADSTNTIEDARLCRPIVARHGFTQLRVVTSDFHLPRAEFLFRREFPAIKLSFVGAKTHLPEAEIQRLAQHEERALARLRAESAQPD